MPADVVDSALQFNSEPLYEFSIYPFSTDPVFQEGLQGIISSAYGKTPEELEYVIGQAKVFYFARTTGHKITWGNYVEWKKSHPSPFPSAPIDPPGEASTSTVVETQTGEQEAPTPLSFQQITDLIKAGQTHLIPNNKVIPEALNNDAPSESTRPVPRKPWENERGQDMGGEALVTSRPSELDEETAASEE